MALTPQDVQNKVFSPTRFRTGYNEDEVDTFLDEVEAELTRLLDENSDTRRQLDEARRTGGGGPGVPPQILEENQQLRRQLDDARRAAAQAQAAAQQAQAQAQAAAARGPSTSPVPIPGGATQVMPAVGQRGGGNVPATTGSQGAQLDAEIEQRVARTLVLAQRTADEALREARTESERARREARSDADRILAEARAHVAEQLGGLEEDKRRLEGQVEQLRAFEREYRTRLRAYLEMQLRDLDGMPTQPAVGAGGPPRPGLNPGQGGQQQPQQPQPAGVGVPAAAYQAGPPAMGGQNGVNHAERDPRAGGMQEF
ncbi:DivIVA domain-containing protein [Pseudofrankia asymbiotica]|uniref:Cell wall synthesis protein Wag31 n=1 Tax=Pseudofrankia asymbiotica TaxID=1834516 RepID=A0A1V2IBS7_9ACTN|nr:DivIVA domain-containing protein [Pseudofrankia asymbiotica]ONH30480.1 cell division protein DivIVA [Pseudofrankia asymbiotica]